MFGQEDEIVADTQEVAILRYGINTVASRRQCLTQLMIGLFDIPLRGLQLNVKFPRVAEFQKDNYTPSIGNPPIIANCSEKVKPDTILGRKSSSCDKIVHGSYMLPLEPTWSRPGDRDDVMSHVGATCLCHKKSCGSLDGVNRVALTNWTTEDFKASNQKKGGMWVPPMECLEWF